MTDFASLLVADRGQKARPIHLVDKDRLRRLAQEAARAEDRALLEAHASTARPASPSCCCRAAASSRWSSAVKNADALSPWCLAKLAESLPEGTYRLAPGEPGKAALGWLLAQHRFDDYRSKKDEPERGPRVLRHRRGGAGSTRRSGWPKRPRWSATSSTRRPATSARPSSSRRSRERRQAARRAGPRHRGRRARRGLSADRRGRRRGDRASARRA